MEIITGQLETNRTEKKITDQFLIDEDINVPDSKRDVQKIMISEGQVRIEEQKPMENYLRVQGKLDYHILYCAEGYDGTFSCLEGSLPFVEMIYLEEGSGIPDVREVRCEMKGTMIHSRKIRIKAMIELELESESRSLEDIPTDVRDNLTVYKKCSEMELLKLHTSKKDMYRIKEEIVLPTAKESIGTLLWTDIDNRRLDTRLAGDELRLEGELLVFCFYESPDGKLDWLEQTVPYEGRVECYGVDEGMYHHVRATLEEIHPEVRLDEDGESRIIGIEGSLGMYIAVYEEEQMEVLEDLYSPNQKCIPEFKDVEYEQLVIQNHSKCKVMERMTIPELKDDILQICHSKGAIRMEKLEMREDGVLAEGAIQISFLYVKADDEVPFDTWQGMVPFSHLIECSETGKDLVYHISALLEQLSISLQGGDEVEVKGVLSFDGFFKKKGTKPMIQSVKTEPIPEEEYERRPGIVGYIVKSGDDLWNLAKRYGTSKDAIREMNELTSDQLKEGDRLLIFKENLGIL